MSPIGVAVKMRQSSRGANAEIGSPNEPPKHLLIGLYARGKLQYDAYHFNFYKRL